MKAKLRIIFLLLGGMGLLSTYTNCAKSPGTSNPVVTAGTATPTPSPTTTPLSEAKLAISSITASHGIFDASLAQDPSSSRIWMSYSTVNPSAIWPVQNFDAVASRLAYSDNQGLTWTDSAALTTSTDVDLFFMTQPPFNLPNDFRAGTWQNEVSNLVYDAGATNPNEKWKLMWMHYLQINGARHFEHHWMGLKMASTPQGLASAAEIKLFTGAAYDTANNIGGGPTAAPVNGAPAFALNTSIPQLNGCIFAEPSMLSTSSALYLSMNCLRGSNDRSNVLLKCANPCQITTVGGTNGWTYVGTTLTDSDSDSFGFDLGFSGTNLVSSGGQYYLIATPVKSTPFDGFYGGCKVFRFTNLNTATLQRSGGVPVVGLSVENEAGTFGGACTYWPTANNAGIIRSQLHINDTEKFTLYLTRINF